MMLLKQGKCKFRFSNRGNVDMRDILDRDLDEAIRNLENMQNEPDKKNRKSQNTREESADGRSLDNWGDSVDRRNRDNWENPGNSETWDDWEEAEDNNAWDTGNSRQDGSAADILQRPGANRGRRGNIFNGFFSGITAEKILEAVLLLVTIGGVICIFLNFEAITWILAAGIAYCVITVGKFVIIIAGVAVCVLFIGFFWRRRRRRRWWR